MHKPILLLAALGSYLMVIAQKTDTLIIHYNTDQYTISKQEKQRLDSFLTKIWDKIVINGYTDETDEEEYNVELSKKRSGTVYDYFLSKQVPSSLVTAQHFGEAMPTADNNTDEGRALNRRTVVIGYQYPRVKLKPKEDPMIPVTNTLDNGFIITYRPGTLPDYLEEAFGSGSGSGFSVITNTTQMRANNLYNNTTNGEILSSVMIICNNGISPCNLDSPVLVKIPIPYTTKCPIEKVKFFNAVAERGKRIWSEQNKDLYPETINGRQYISLWMDNLCGCINFDFKIDPDCFDVDSTKILYTNTEIKNLTTELWGLNSVYIPKKNKDGTDNILFLKDQKQNAGLSFALYDGKRRIRSFRNEQLAAFPYDEEKGRYLLKTGRYKFHFPKQNVWEVVLRVNDDKYRGYPNKNKFDFIYLNRKKEEVLVDFAIVGPRKHVIYYRNQPLSSLPFDEKSGYYIIDKKTVKLLQEKSSVSIK